MWLPHATYKMQHSKRPDFSDFSSTASRSRSRSRSTSISSDSQLSRIHLLAPPSVNPPASFIAPSSASQIITTDQEFNAADFVADDDDSGAFVTADALSSLNGFLDHLLFNILAAAKSTQLSSIRPAVAEVLKPRLAKEVVSVADEELSEYLGGPEDEQLEFRGGQIPKGEFDLIRSWKLTRLRCMVYTRLGDMEEDDEEEYIAQAGLVDDEGAPRRFTNHISNITPAAAIFLTSIIEHIGEQALIIAGETARSRLSSKLVLELDEDAETGKERGSMKRLIVEELDVEKLALNPTLGRLWRTWRKRTRMPNLSRMASRDSLRRGPIGPISHSSKSSFSVADDAQSQLSPPVETRPEVDPVSIPLPMGENDIQEIENYDFPLDIEGGEIQTMQAVVAHKVRPRSLMVLTLQSPRSSNANSPVSPGPRSAPPVTRHSRSRSLPSAPYPPEVPGTDKAARRPSPTASEERRCLETMYEQEEREETEKVEKSAKVEDGKEDQKLEAPPAMESLQQGSKVQMIYDTLQKDAPSKSQIETFVTKEITAQLIENVAGSTSSNAEAPATFLIKRDTEVIEGQGICEKPTSSSVQRPKRKQSRDVSQRHEQSAHSVPLASERVVTTVVEGVPEKQSGDVPILVRPVVARAPFTEPGSSLPPTPVREVRPSLDSTREEGSRSASNSGDSTHSGYSRAYHRPGLLTLTDSNQRRSGASVSSSLTERAGVQRISTQPSTSAASSNYSRPRRSGSFSSHRENRPLTAGSTTSQVSNKLKGLISRPIESASPRLRSSSETTRVSGETGDSYDDKTGLDKLIRSEETIHYTLTPKSVREMDFPDTANWQVQRSNTADLADFLKSTGPEDTTYPRAPTTSSRVTQVVQPSPKSRSPDFPKHSPIQAARISPTQMLKTGQARDARPSVESSHDFAQFIRNSGPNSPSNTVTSTVRRSSNATDLPKKPSRADSALSNQTRGPKLQARPAAVPKNNHTSDLIDFIREGPPTVGARRIPRTVAPFRSTMDSDDLDYEQGAPSFTSTQGESTGTKSQVSVGSRTGLLDSSNGANTRAGPTRLYSSSPSKLMGDEDPRPKRTQRRAPDPYAIDWDDGDFQVVLEKPKPKREEESLIDFLRNVPPPASETQIQPFSLSNPPNKASIGGFRSASAMKARLGRNTSSEKVPSTKSSRTSLRQPSDQSSNYAPKISTKRHAGNYGLSSVSERQTETSALAEFLRNTGPPDLPAPRVPPSKDTRFSRRLFVRRKKVEV